MSKTTIKYSPEERAVRMVLDNEGQHASRWAAILSTSSKVGCAGPTLNEWVKGAKVDRGSRASVANEMAEKMKALERKNRELRQANEILRKGETLSAIGPRTAAKVRSARPSPDVHVKRGRACAMYSRESDQSGRFSAPANTAQEPNRAQEGLPSYIRDHRRRLRERFMAGGAAALPDYELLELVLFRAIPRQDVKPLARLLLDAFGDFNRVVSAPAERLRKVRGVGEAVVVELKILEAAAQRLARSRVMQRPVVSSWQELIDYCHTAMAHAETEQFRVLYLDRKNVVIADEEQARGTVDHVPVDPREIAKRALELNASAMILVHNHPSDDPTPSEADISMTLRIKDAADVLGLVLHDHLIIGKSRELSFRSAGLL